MIIVAYKEAAQGPVLVGLMGSTNLFVLCPGLYSEGLPECVKSRFIYPSLNIPALDKLWRWEIRWPQIWGSTHHKKIINRVEKSDAKSEPKKPEPMKVGSQQSAYSRGRHSVNQEMMGSKPTMRTKIIKRYQNRKLYDTQQSCYVTLDDIAKMIRASEDVMVIDNKTKNDITAATLTQIIFEAEKKASQYAPLFTLREIIQNGNGSISSFLAKLGAFPQDYAEKQAQAKAESSQQAEMTHKASYDDVKKTLDDRVASAANVANAAKNFEDQSSGSDLPDLPNSNKSLNTN